mmetsp:Transcript_6169/g.12062  ORF Transcript_6169/g.12062 Transcript_6169/m.12062 type:complete len:82 (+) Transcript_6169:134-379(+)
MDSQDSKISPARSPIMAPVDTLLRKSSTNAREVWTKTFHPLGRAPSDATKFDVGSPPGSGESISEIYAKKSSFSLDERPME